MTNTRLKFKATHAIAAVLFFLFLPACSGLSPQKNEELAQLQNRMDETSLKLDEIYHRMSVIQFMVDSHEKTLRDLESPIQPDRLSKPVPATGTAPQAQAEAATAMVSEGPETIYNTALSAYNNQNYDQAIERFGLLIRKHPDHDLADNALYWTGECLYAQKDYRGAIDQFKKLIESYPKGGKVPDALLKTGYSYFSLNDFVNARIYFKKVIVNYPFSPAGSKAEAMLKRIR